MTAKELERHSTSADREHWARLGSLLGWTLFGWTFRRDAIFFDEAGQEVRVTASQRKSIMRVAGFVEATLEKGVEAVFFTRDGSARIGKVAVLWPNPTVISIDYEDRLGRRRRARRHLDAVYLCERRGC